MGKAIIWDGNNPLPTDQNRILIVARNGLFQVKKLILGDQVVISAITRIGDGWDDGSLHIFEDGERLQLGFAEKIPLILYQQVVSFFDAIRTKLGTEAMVYIFYAPLAPAGNHWQVLVPIQLVEDCRCTAEDPGVAPAGWYLAGDFHSHGDGGAFHSPIDDRDEAHRDGIFVTVGFTGSIPSVDASVVVDGVRFPVFLSDVVEGVPSVRFPEEWLKRVKQKPRPAPSTSRILGREAGSDPLSSFRVS